MFNKQTVKKYIALNFKNKILILKQLIEATNDLC